jgi:hypothetical protein
MTESSAAIVFDIMLLLIAAVGAVLWNLGIINSAISAGALSNPAVQIFVLVVAAILLAEVYIVNTDTVKVKMKKAFSDKDEDFYEKARAQRQ